MPPKIVDSLSSSDMVQTEGSNVTLECATQGSPEPEVVWRREDAREITIDKNTTGMTNNIKMLNNNDRMSDKSSKLVQDTILCSECFVDPAGSDKPSHTLEE